MCSQYIGVHRACLIIRCRYVAAARGELSCAHAPSTYASMQRRHGKHHDADELALLVP